MQQVLIGAVESKVQDHARTGWLIAPPALEAGCRPPSEQVAVRAYGIGVRHHGGQRHLFSRLRFDPTHRAMAYQQTPYAGVRTDLHAQVNGETGQGARDGARATLGIPHPFPGLHVAMLHNTAGEASGAEPTYWVK